MPLFTRLMRKTVSRLVPYVPGKPMEEVKRELGIEDLVKLASNENPLGPSPRALAAMERALPDVRLYPDDSCYALTKELARHLGQPENRILVGRGSDEIIHLAGLAYLNPREEVIMPDPPFALYPATAAVMDALAIQIPMRCYEQDVVAIADAITDRTKLIFLANPNNPTGTMVTQEDVQWLIERLPPHVILCLDEAYHEYVDDHHYPDSLEWVNRGRNVMVFRTFSKIYALAGLRIGYGIFPDHLVGAVRQVRPPFNVSSMAQIAALESLRDPEQVERSRKVNAEGREFLYREFERLSLAYVPTQANFILVDLEVDCGPVFDALLREGVIVRTGDIFGYPTHIRVTIGTEDQNRRFIRALEKVLGNARAGMIAAGCAEGKGGVAE